MVELVDTHPWGGCGSNPLEVQVLFRPPIDMDFKTIFSKNFLFASNLETTNQLTIPLLVIFGLMIVLAVVIAMQKAETKKIVGGFFIPFVSAGVLGLIYLFSRYESLPYFSSRFFLVLTVTMFIIWNTVLLFKAIKFVPKHISHKKVEDRYQKYLPKPKRR